jgi:hypothetical protein
MDITRHSDNIMFQELQTVTTPTSQTCTKSKFWREKTKQNIKQKHSESLTAKKSMNVKPCSVLYFISLELKNLNLSSLLSDQANAGSPMKPLTKGQECKYVLLVKTITHLRGSDKWVWSNYKMMFLGNPNNLDKWPVPVPLCSPQNLHDVKWDQKGSMVRNWRLTA